MISLTFAGDPIRYVAPSLTELDTLGFRLARQVLAGGVPLERTVVISNGALPYALAFHNHVGNRGKIVTIGISYYDFDQLRARAEVVQELSDDVRGKQVFLLDEVVDRGGTMPVARDHILAAGAASVTTGTLVYKRRSLFRPDFVGAAIDDEWVVFPHDLRPTVEHLGARWLGAGVSAAEARERFRQLFAGSAHLDEQVDCYLAPAAAQVEAATPA